MRYRWFDVDGTEKEKPGMPRRTERQEEPAPVKKPRGARGELVGILLTVVVLLYGVATEDLPIIYLAMAFLVYEMRPFAMLLKAPVGPFLGNLLWGFSIALFFGAIFMAFF